MRTSKLVSVVVASAGLCGLVLLAQGKDPAKDAKDAKGTRSSAPDPASMDPQAMMAAWEQASRPTEHHAKLIRDMQGNWKVTGNMWMSDGAPPMPTTATAKGTAMFGGRFIQWEYRSEMMGQPFAGLGYHGYNNGTQQFESMWIDSASTGMMMMTGTEKQDGSIEFRGSYTDPMTREARSMRAVTRMTNPDTLLYTMYDTGSDGKEFKTMELTYTREAASAKPKGD